MSAKVDMGCSETHGLEKRLTLLGETAVYILKCCHSTIQSMSDDKSLKLLNISHQPFPRSELELKKEKEKVAAGDVDLHLNLCIRNLFHSKQNPRPNLNMHVKQYP